MAKERNAFKAGLFIVVSIALIIGVIVAIKGIGRLLEPEQVRTVTFTLADDVGGLRVGDDVRVGGLKVGIVRWLQIDAEHQPPRIVVSFNMPRRLVLREGTRLGVQNTITGGSWLNFDRLGDGKPLADDAVLTGSPGTFTQLLATVNDLAPELKNIAHDIRTVTLPKVNATADNAAKLTSDLRGRLDAIIERYNKVADRLAEAMANLRDILGDTKMDFRTTMANVSSATGTLKDKLPPVMEKLDGTLAKVSTSIDTAQSALKDLNDTMANAKELSASARSIVARNRTRVDELVTSLKDAGENLKYATAEIRHSPWRLLYKPRAGEVSNLNLFDAARQFSDGANSMSDAATALRDALKDPQSNPEQIQKLVNQLDESFGKFQKVEDELWNRVKE
jgi:ABC-type transporter Mla subunit MlaD